MLHMQRQKEEEMDELTTRLIIKEKENMKLKEEQRLLKMSEFRNHMPFEVKVYEVPLSYVCVQQLFECKFLIFRILIQFSMHY